MCFCAFVFFVLYSFFFFCPLDFYALLSSVPLLGSSNYAWRHERTRKDRRVADHCGVGRHVQCPPSTSETCAHEQPFQPVLALFAPLPIVARLGHTYNGQPTSTKPPAPQPCTNSHALLLVASCCFLLLLIASCCFLTKMLSTEGTDEAWK